MSSLRALLDAKLLKERGGAVSSHLPTGGRAAPSVSAAPTLTPSAQPWGRGLMHRESAVAQDESSRPSPAIHSRSVTFGAETRDPPSSEIKQQRKSPLEDAPQPKPSAAEATSQKSTDPIESLADEERHARVSAAENLLAFLTAPVYLQWLKLPGVAGSRIPAASTNPHDRAVARLADISAGGKTGAKNDDLRRCLSDVGRYNDAAHVVGGIFPIAADHAEAVRIWLEGRDTTLPPKSAEPTAAARLSGSLAYARELGFPVDEIPAPMAGFKRVRVQSTTGDNARAAPPPLLIVQMDTAARGGVLGEPATIYAQLMYWDLLLQARGRDIHASEVLAPDVTDKTKPEGVLHTKNFLDKNDRADVHQWAPLLSMVTGEALPWADDLVARLAGQAKFTFPDWVSAGTGKTGILDATELVLKTDGSLSYCKKKRASSQIDPLTSRISGRTIAQLREEKLTGTHWMRNLGGDVTTYLDWTDKDADILGDWATPVADGPEPAAAKRQRGKAQAKSTRQKFYRANAPQDEQIEVRTRFYMAVAAAIQAFGAPNLKWETTWREVIPPPADAPAALRPFYGPRTGHAPTLPSSAASSSVVS